MSQRDRYNRGRRPTTFVSVGQFLFFAILGSSVYCLVHMFFRSMSGGW